MSRGDRFTLLGFDPTLLDGGDDAAFSVKEWRAPVGAGGIPIHLHHHTEEAFYVLDGALGLWLDKGPVTYPSGAYVVVAPGRPHTFWNAGETCAAYLTVISPRGFERYLVELANGLRQISSDDEAGALRERLGAAYEITVVGPPLRGPRGTASLSAAAAGVLRRRVEQDPDAPAGFGGSR